MKPNKKICFVAALFLISCICLGFIYLPSFIDNFLHPNRKFSPEIETRAVWLNQYAFNSDENRGLTMEKILGARLNTVFLIAPSCNGNHGWSSNESFNAMLQLLTSHEISVHAWLTNMYRISGQKADFISESEQLAQSQWAADILSNYPLLNGVHFDYIRYSYGEPVNSTKMMGILHTLLLTHSSIHTQFPEKYFTAASWPLSGELLSEDDEIPEWFDLWFSNSSHNPINRWNTPVYNNSGFPLTFSVQQDPIEWIKSAALDAVFSMEYSASNSWWQGEVDLWNSFFEGNPDGINMGLGWYSGVWNDDDNTGDDITPNSVAGAMATKIFYGRNHNIHGFALFEFGEPETDDSLIIDQLAGREDAPFYYPARSYFG